jgi:hypothetical protein
MGIYVCQMLVHGNCMNTCLYVKCIFIERCEWSARRRGVRLREKHVCCMLCRTRREQTCMCMHTYTSYWGMHAATRKARLLPAMQNQRKQAYIYIYIYMYVCIYIYIYIYMHTYTSYWRLSTCLKWSKFVRLCDVLIYLCAYILIHVLQACIATKYIPCRKAWTQKWSLMTCSHNL